MTAETYSKLIHPGDRTVRTLFGDGAAATPIGGGEGKGGRLGEFVIGTDGGGAGEPIVPSGGFRLPLGGHDGGTRGRRIGPQPGPLIHGWSSGVRVYANRVPPAVNHFVQKSGLSRDQVDWYVFHQANKYMLDMLAKCGKIPNEKMAYHLAEVGNTVSLFHPLDP